MCEIDESGALTVKEVPDGKLSTKIVIKATRKSDETELVLKTLLFRRVPLVNPDGTVTFKAEHSGSSLHVIGDFVQWDT